MKIDGLEEIYGNVSGLIIENKLLLMPISKYSGCETLVIDLVTERIVRHLSLNNKYWSDMLACRFGDGSIIRYDAVDSAWQHIDNTLNIRKVYKIVPDDNLLRMVKQAGRVDNFEFPLTEYSNFNLVDCLDYFVSIYEVTEENSKHELSGERIKEKLIA